MVGTLVHNFASCPASYCSRHTDNQPTPRRRSDNILCNYCSWCMVHHTPNEFMMICLMCQIRRHSAIASNCGYYRNKSNSSVGSVASGTHSGSSLGSKVVARRTRRSSDATNLLFSATLGFSNLLSAGSRDKLASQPCTDENVAEMWCLVCYVIWWLFYLRLPSYLVNKNYQYKITTLLLWIQANQYIYTL